MMEFDSIDRFLTHMAVVAERLRPARERGLHIAGQALVASAQDLVGTEDDAWAPLADRTVAEKERLGYTGRVSATDPLLRTGELRDSIEAALAPTNANGSDGVLLGSNDQVMAYQEHGTQHIPPRPVISLTMMRHGHDAAEVAAGYEMAALASERSVRRLLLGSAAERALRWARNARVSNYASGPE